MAKERSSGIKNRRQMEIAEIIQSGRYPNSRTLAKHFEVTPLTIKRDIEYLRNFYSAPIEYDHNRHGYYYTDETFFIKSFILSEGELFCMSVIQPLLENYRNTPLEQTIAGIFYKLCEFMPNEVSIDTSFFSGNISFISDPLAKISEEIFNTLFKALKMARRISFEYKNLSDSEYSFREVDPYHIVCQKGSWYLLGLCHKNKDVRIFSLSRMRKIKINEEPAPLPEDFSVKKYIDLSFGAWVSTKEPVLIELEFSKSINTLIMEREWHENQILKQNEDGSVYLAFKSNQMQTAIHWIMSFGSAVKVLNPPELVNLIKCENQKMLEMYK